MNRREFLEMGLMASIASGAGASAFAADEVPLPKIDHRAAKPRNRNPYAGIDWAKVFQLNGATHMHAPSEAVLDAAVKHGIEFFTISNYHPAAPTWPGATARRPRGLPVSDWPLVVNGRLTKGPFDWNKLVASWMEHPEQVKGRRTLPYPFKEGPLLYPHWPKGRLEAPNAEHAQFRFRDGTSTRKLHLCCPGSAFASGTFDSRNAYKLGTNGYEGSCGQFWGDAIDRMIDALIDPEGGGVTINHPTWTHLDRAFLLELLDWDPRVLGIEVLSNGYNSEHYWDWVLSTGRQCYGFFTPDWGWENDADFGVNVLVVPEKTVHACLKAYRDGDFYGARRGYGELRFTSIAFDGAALRATTDKPARFEVKTARGVVATGEGNEIVWTVPQADRKNSRVGPEVEVFVRLKAYAADGCGETLWTQAFMLVDGARG